MRKESFTRLAAIFVLGGAAYAAPVTNWVSESGSDISGNGTIGAPYRSITKALATSGITRIEVGAGTFDAANGEVFPLSVPSGVSIIGTAGPASILDGAYANRAITLGAGTSVDRIANLLIRRAKGTAIVAGAWQGTIADCTITDVANGGASDNASLIAYYNVNVSRAITLSGVTFSNVTCNVQRFLSFRGVGTVAITNCTFRNLTTSVAPSQSSGTMHFVYADNTGNSGFAVSFLDSRFESITVPGASQNEGGFILAGAPSLLVDRCLFRDITFSGVGTSLIGPNRCGSVEVRNSLFFDLNCGTTYSAIGGFRTQPRVRNCTFNNVTAAFRPNSEAGYYMYVYNTSVSDCGSLNRQFGDYLYLYNVNIYNTPAGSGYSAANSTGVTSYAPWYASAAAKDFRLRTLSPLVDIGNNAAVIGALDLDRATRLRDGDGNGTATTDIGCFESNFLAPASARFRAAKPVYALFRGTSNTIPVWIQPSAAGIVTSHVAYAVDLSGASPLAFGAGATTNNLTISAADPLTVANGTLGAIALTETNTAHGVAAGEIGVYLHEKRVTLTGFAPRIFIRTNATNDYPVRFERTDLAAPVDVTIATGTPSGTGNNQLAWLGDNRIVSGQVQSTGYLRAIGGAGQNFVQLTLDQGFVFVETGTASLTVEVIGFQSPLHVAPTGSNTTGLGTQANPLRTLTYAVPQLRKGEEAVLAAGRYNAASTETFPITVPEGIFVTGVRGATGTDADTSIIDPGQSTGAFVLGTLGPDPGAQGAGGLRNLIVTDAKGTAIRARYWGGTISNSVVRNVVNGSAYDSTAGVYVEGGRGTIRLAQLTMTNIVANTRRMLYVASSGTVLLTDGIFRNLQNTTATGGGGVFELRATATVADCVFASIKAVGDDNREQGWLFCYDKVLNVNRCVFRDFTITGNQLQIVSPNRQPATIANSLFANIQSGAARPVIGGFRATPTVRNCTFDNVSCVFRPNEDGAYPMYVHNSSVGYSALLNPEASSTRPLVLRNVNLYSTPLGAGGYAASSVNVTSYEPGYVDRAAGNFRLRTSSPLLDLGNNSYVTSDIGVVDLERAARIVDSNYDSVLTVDLGAYELRPPPQGTVVFLR